MKRMHLVRGEPKVVIFAKPTGISGEFDLALTLSIVCPERATCQRRNSNDMGGSENLSNPKRTLEIGKVRRCLVHDLGTRLPLVSERASTCSEHVFLSRSQRSAERVNGKLR